MEWLGLWRKEVANPREEGVAGLVGERVAGPEKGVATPGKIDGLRWSGIPRGVLRARGKGRL